MKHIEQHFFGSDTVRDVVIGMADGLTVPFALAAGISVALTSSHIVVTAGLAEIAAGSIAMGLGGYLAAMSDASRWIQFVLATPVVLWACWPFFRRGWRSLVARPLNMFTLIAIGLGAAFVYSAVAMLLPGVFPPAMQHGGQGRSLL